jgi:hypothetical protein
MVQNISDRADNALLLRGESRPIILSGHFRTKTRRGTWDDPKKEGDLSKVPLFGLVLRICPIIRYTIVPDRLSGQRNKNCARGLRTLKNVQLFGRSTFHFSANVLKNLTLCLQPVHDLVGHAFTNADLFVRQFVPIAPLHRVIA